LQKKYNYFDNFLGGKDMTKRDILSIAVTVLGINYLFYFLSMVPISILQSILNKSILPKSDNSLLFYLIYLAIYLIVGLLLVIKSDQISAFILSKDREIQIPSIIGNEVHIIAIALLIIGLFFSFSGILEFIKSVVSYSTLHNLIQAGRFNNYKAYLNSMIDYWILIKVVFGLTIAFSATKIANWFCGIGYGKEEVTADE
jgi:hypothetical protein